MFPTMKATDAAATGPKALRPLPGPSRMRHSRPTLTFQTRSSQHASEGAPSQCKSRSVVFSGGACDSSSLLDGLMTEVRMSVREEPLASRQATDFSRLFDKKRKAPHTPLHPIDANSNSTAGLMESEGEVSDVALQPLPAPGWQSSGTGGSGPLFARPARPIVASSSGRLFEDVASVGGLVEEDKENSRLGVPSVVALTEAPLLIKGHLMKAEYPGRVAPGQNSGPSASTISSQLSCQTEVGVSTRVAEVQQQMKNPPMSRRPPLDLSLKTRMQFTSDRPFDVVESLPSPDAWAEPAGSEGLGPTNEERYKRALQSYSFPDDPMDQSDVAAATSTKSGISRMGRRRERWESAFFSLYTKLQDGGLDVFYYISPQGTKRCDFTALVRGPGISGSDCLTATVSRSTAALRGLLAAEGVRFSMPFATGKEVATDSDACSRGQHEAATAATDFDGTPASALALSGALAVGGLFQVLDMGGGSGSDCGTLFEAGCDVPMLLAPMPFVHATLPALQPQVRYSSLRAAMDHNKRQRLPGYQAPKFKVQLDGIIPPWVADRLVLALASLQEFNMSASFDTLWHSCSLNAPPLPPPVKELTPSPHVSSPVATRGVSCWSTDTKETSQPNRAWSTRGYVSSEEAQRWRQSPSGSLSENAAAVATLEYQAATRMVHACLYRPPPPKFVPAVHMWQT